MIDFIELNEAQKKYIIYIIDRFNHNSDIIDLNQMNNYHEIMLSERSNTKIKFGFPNWLIKPFNKVSKSVYYFPLPSEDNLIAFKNGDVGAHLKLEKYSPLFQQVVKDYKLS